MMKKYDLILRPMLWELLEMVNRVFLWRGPESLSGNEVAFPFKIFARYIPSKSTFQDFDSCKLELCLEFIKKIQLEIVGPAQHSLQESKNICICFSSLKLMNHHISNVTKCIEKNIGK